MPTKAKYEADLAKTLGDIDRVEGRIIRWVNKLADLRAKKKRLQKKVREPDEPKPSPKPTTPVVKRRRSMTIKYKGIAPDARTNLEL